MKKRRKNGKMSVAKFYLELNLSAALMGDDGMGGQGQARIKVKNENFLRIKKIDWSEKFAQTARETTVSLRRRTKELTFLCKATEFT